MSSTPAPTTVKIAFWILLVGLIIDLVSGVVFIISGFALQSSGQTANVDGTVTGGGIFIATGIVVLVLALIELIILWKLRAGRNWARIVITILEILALGSVFAGVSVLSTIAIVLSIVALVLLWLPASNAYFRR
ncbi:hypothetical protein J2Y69_000712 [Microbacterium resistens]|uniref:DUF2127 domain-containing protein n=1 Tax=Microbacterium resistens TaxID=156977 RepID=A0ABU1S941_9MICO|nr:hypothetical protein [Microbacterium resistens]MDR6866127.1 hypothetical protein [Microbacterium resistens]